MQALTRDEAVALCSKVREQSHAVLSSIVRRECWQCRRASGGNPDLMYMSRKPGYLGCDLINRLRARIERAHSA